MARFGPTALVVAGALGLGGGVAVAASVGPATFPVAAVQQQAPHVPEEATDAGSPDVEITDEGLLTSARGHDPAERDSRWLLPDGPLLPDPALLTPASPAEPAPLDPDAVDAYGLTLADRAAGLLSTEVPDVAEGTLTVVPGSSDAPEPDRPVRAIRVEVEDGLDIDGELFAEMVMTTLNDPRGWGADGSVSFARTDGDTELRVVLASPGTVDELCAPLETVGLYSCGTRGHAVLNHMRWVRATDEFDDRTQYRQYLVNHEVGHLLGHGHLDCPGEGELAPLMQQQTIKVGPCEPNGWPFPEVEVPED